MTLNLDSTRRGPSGRRILRLPRAATTPATPTAPAAPTTPTAPAAPTTPRPDVFDIMRSAPRRRATRAQLEMLAQRWGKP